MHNREPVPIVHHYFRIGQQNDLSELQTQQQDVQHEPGQPINKLKDI